MPDARQVANLLDAYRQARAPSPEQLDQALAGVHARVDAADFPVPDVEAPIPDPVGASIWAGWPAKIAVATALVGVPIAVGLAMDDGGHERGDVTLLAVPPPVTAVEATPVEPEPAAAADGIAEPAGPVAEPELAPAVVREREARKPSAPKAAITPQRPPRGIDEPPPGIDEEMRLLGQAGVALKQGHHRRALRLVQEHAQQYPDSTLAETREVTRTLALAASGRHDDACAARDRFVARWPQSPYRHRVEKSCTAAPAK